MFYFAVRSFRATRENCAHLIGKHQAAAGKRQLRDGLELTA
jgi:hypothetical protein